MTDKNKNMEVSFDDFLAEQMKDPVFKAGADAEGAKLESAVALMTEREHTGLTQRELASMADVPQSVVKIPAWTL